MLARLRLIKKHLKDNTQYNWKKNCMKPIKYIPSFLTFLNAVCGFLSIITSLEGKFIFSSYYIIMAVILDGLDGRLARKLGLSSPFGSELDSLCDAISFCLAPIILIYCWYPSELGFMYRLSLISYLCAGLGRLAKFNITLESQHKYFIGLPTTLAAFSIVSLILSYKWFATKLCGIMLTKQVLFSLIFLLALLMISRIRFYSFKNYKIAYPIGYVKSFFIGIIMVLLYIKGYPILFFSLSLYIFVSVIHDLGRLIIKH